MLLLEQSAKSTVLRLEQLLLPVLYPAHLYRRAVATQVTRPLQGLQVPCEYSCALAHPSCNLLFALADLPQQSTAETIAFIVANIGRVRSNVGAASGLLLSKSGFS